MNKTLFGLSKFIVFEISQCLSLKDTLILSGVCKELHRKIHCSFGKGVSANYICLRKDNLGYLNESLTRTCKYSTNTSVYVVGILLKAGVDIDNKNRYGNTALMLASWNGITKIIKLLLKYGARVNIRDEHGGTALIDASGQGQNGAVEILLDAGADPYIQNFEYKDTAFTKAFNNDHTHVVELLKKRGIFQ